MPSVHWIKGFLKWHLGWFRQALGQGITACYRRQNAFLQNGESILACLLIFNCLHFTFAAPAAPYEVSRGGKL